jgi:multicomponent Na+:H+ antiporter subunit E
MSRTLLGRLLLVAWLALVWTALWGSFDAGTMLAGVLVGVLVTVALREEVPDRPGSLRPLAALRFALVFLWMLAKATFEVVGAVVSPGRRVAPAVVPVTLAERSPMVVTIVANSITLTPGTITLDAVPKDDGTAELLVHALNASDPEAVRQDALRLHRLAAAALRATPQDRGAAR